MNQIFNIVDGLFAGVVPIADFLWDFPTNFEWYSSIPILGQFSLAILMLLGGGVYFSFKTKFVQITHFKTGLKTLIQNKQSEIGTSQLAAFMLSTASRVGAGNIVGVTGAVSIGGPGAIFWMWLSAFLGMSTSFAESTLAQIFKERKENEYVGGITFYVQKIWGNFKWVGFGMCVMYLIYNMLSIPVHTFHVFTAASSVIDAMTGTVSSPQDSIYYVIAIVIIVSIIAIVFGGINRVTNTTDKMVPIMAIAYTIIVLILVVLNITKVPGFFAMVFGGAFKPQAVFGGAFGVAMSQGLKRGLLSNEAGMGTTTQASSIADANHPCEQGFIQSISVFLDTIIICSFTGFIVTAGQIWTNPSFDWQMIKVNKINLYLQSVRVLVPGESFDTIVVIFVAVAFGLFAFTTLLSDVVFAEIAASKISKKKGFTNFIRGLGAIIFVPLGTLTVLAGLQLDNLWYVSDLINVILVLINIPTLFVGRKYIMMAYQDYKNSDGKRFVSANIGIETEVWSEQNNR